MIKILVNDQEMQLEGSCISDVISQFRATPPFAVALNGDFIPRSHYAERQVEAGDCIDIVAPIVGG